MSIISAAKCEVEIQVQTNPDAAPQAALPEPPIQF